MIPNNKFYSLLLIPSMIAMFSCQKKANSTNDMSAYFGGKISHAKSSYVLFCKDNNVIDTLFLDNNNEFGKKFESLQPGMYIIKYGNNTKYVYFDKNDSLHLRINSKDFENLSSFYGTGKEKNNFLLELFSKVRSDHNRFDMLFEKDYKTFIRNAQSMRDARMAMYLRRKTEIGWDRDFDHYVKAIIDFAYYTQLEAYSYLRLKNENNQSEVLPEDYFEFRKKIDFNDESFAEFKPFTRYLSVLLSSITYEKSLQSALDKSLFRMNIVDSLISNDKVKNKVLNNLAYSYLLEDQTINNNNVFLKKYVEMSSDSIQINEIKKLQQSINSFTKESKLKDFDFRDRDMKIIKLLDTISKPTVITFWTKNALNHFKKSNDQIALIQQKHPEIQFVSINIDNDENVLKMFESLFPRHSNIYLQATDFEELRDQWVILRLNRAIYINKNGYIVEGFINIFDDQLKLN